MLNRDTSSSPSAFASVSTIALTPAGAGESSLSGFRRWVVEHDEKLLFTVLYIGLAVVLSVWISLFWLLAVVSVHLVLELVRQSHRFSGARAVTLQALWELKLDVALVLMALVLALYMEMILGVAGLQGAARMGTASRVLARFSGWERTIRGILLSADDAAQLARVAGTRRGRANAPRLAAELEADGSTSWSRRWNRGAWLAMGLAIVCVALLLAAPLLTPHTPSSALEVLRRELRPFP